MVKQPGRKDADIGRVGGRDNAAIQGGASSKNLITFTERDVYANSDIIAEGRSSAHDVAWLNH